MFRKISIQNFKSLANTTVELGPFTVLVGSNGAGKSSFLQVIELVSWAVRHDSLNDALAANSVDFRDLVYLRAQRKAVGFEAELEVAVPDAASIEKVSVSLDLAKRRYVYVQQELINRWGAEPSQSPYLVGSVQRQRFATEQVSDASNQIRHENVALSHSMLRDVWLARGARGRFPVLYQVARHFTGYVHYEIWGPENLRQPSPAGPGSRLGKRGENLPKLLRQIRQNEQHWGGLRDELKDAYPAISDIRFVKGLMGEWGLLFEERPRGVSRTLHYRPTQMSDGFLRLLGLLAIKHQPAPLSVLGYEEPENGLHPSALDDCMRHLKAIAAGGTQVIVTTHSPYLLNHLLEDDSEPRAELRLVWRDTAGRTSIAPPDPQKIEQARRQGFGIGELWGMLLDERELAQS